MNTGLFFFPRLTAELATLSKYKASPYTFSYYLQPDKSSALQGSFKNNKGTLTDPYEIWKLETDGLRLARTITIANAKALYGAGGVAPFNSELGVCLLWTNTKLTQTGIILPVSRQLEGGVLTYVFDHCFPAGTVSGNLVLDVALYLKRASSTIKPGEEQLINEPGVLLGSFEPPLQLVFEDDAMEFPISEFNEPGGPLWKILFFDWEDPREDKFNAENLVLMLNSSHPECPSIGNTGISNITLLKEILGSAYYLIFEKVKDFEDGLAWDDLQTDTNLEEGSICSVLHWFTEQGGDNVFDWSSPEGRMLSVKRVIDTMFEGMGK